MPKNPIKNFLDNPIFNKFDNKFTYNNSGFNSKPKNFFIENNIFNKGKKNINDASYLMKKNKMGNKNNISNINNRANNFNKNQSKSLSNVNANRIAKSLGFKNTSDFDTFIKKINQYKLNSYETEKVLKLYKYLKNVAKKHPKSIAKLAIAGGSLTAMIIFIKKYQNVNSGCFRYEIKGKDLNSTIQYKFDHIGLCDNNNNNSNRDNDNTDENDSDNINILPKTEHPSYNFLKCASFFLFQEQLLCIKLCA